MPNSVRLDNVDHHDLKYTPRHGVAFGDAVNQVLVLPSEFTELAREYPILFRRHDDGSFYAVALLGLDRDENLFLDGERWNARYVPAMRARGPFSIALTGQPGDAGHDALIHADLDDPRLGRGAGEPLFRTHGGNAPALEQVTQILRTIHQGKIAGAVLFSALAAEGLVAPLNIDIQSEGGGGYHIGDVFSVSRDALAALDGAALQRLNAAGFLAPAFMVLASLGNLQRLIELKNQKRAVMA